MLTLRFASTDGSYIDGVAVRGAAPRGPHQRALVSGGAQGLLTSFVDLDGANEASIAALGTEQRPVEPSALLGVHEHGGKLYVVAAYGILSITR